jgi:hypothetical protein
MIYLLKIAIFPWQNVSLPEALPKASTIRYPISTRRGAVSSVLRHAANAMIRSSEKGVCASDVEMTNVLHSPSKFWVLNFDPSYTPIIPYVYIYIFDGT